MAYPTAGSFVSFKVGSQSTIDNWISNPSNYTNVIKEGTFYLTEDSHRLYIGNSDHTISAVNEGIEKYPNRASLPAKTAAIVGRFCYVTSENILCIGISYMNGSTVAYDWMQVNANTDHYHKDFSRNASEDSTNNSVTITDSFTNEVNAPTNLSVTFVGDDGIVITDETTQNAVTPVIKISGEVYTISVDAGDTTGEVDIDLTASNDSSNSSSITLKPGSNINLSLPTTGTDSGKLVISASNDVPNSFSMVAAENDGNGFVGTIGIDGHADVTGTFDPVIKTGATGSETSTHFVNGEAVLPVYTKTEIDGFLQGLNAMHYIGTVNSSGTGTGASSVNLSVTPNTASIVEDGETVALQLKVGDTLLVNGSGINGKNPGTLLIATGTEGSDGYITAATLKFEVVEETYFTDTNYELTWLPDDNNTMVPSIALKTAGSGGSIVGGATTFAGGTAITVTPTRSGDNQTLTINHGTVVDPSEVTTTETNAVDQNKAVTSTYGTDATTQISVVTGVTVNAQGHVTGVTKTNYNLHDTNTVLSSNQYDSNVYTTSGTNVGVITNTVEDTNSANNHNTAAGKTLIASDTLSISAVGTNDGYGSTSAVASNGLTGLKIEMTWGTF